MKHEFTHIHIESKAFPLDWNFSDNCDEASRQERIARHGLDLLDALHQLVTNTRPAEQSDSNHLTRLANYNEAWDNAVNVIEAATGKRPKF